MNSYQNIVKGHFLLNFFSQKDEKLHTTGLDDTAILLHVKKKIKEIDCLLNTINPYVPFNLDNGKFRFGNLVFGTLSPYLVKWHSDCFFSVFKYGKYCFDHLFI